MKRRNFLASIFALPIATLPFFKRKKQRQKAQYFFRNTDNNPYPTKFIPLENDSGPIALNSRWIEVAVINDKATIFMTGDEKPYIFTDGIDRIKTLCEEKYKFGLENPEQINKPTKYVQAGQFFLDANDLIWGKQGEWTLWKTKG